MGHLAHAGNPVPDRRRTGKAATFCCAASLRLSDFWLRREAAMLTSHAPRHFERVPRQRIANPLDLAQQAPPRPCKNTDIWLAFFMTREEKINYRKFISIVYMHIKHGMFVLFRTPTSSFP